MIRLDKRHPPGLISSECVYKDPLWCTKVQEETGISDCTKPLLPLGSNQQSPWSSSAQTFKGSVRPSARIVNLKWRLVRKMSGEAHFGRQEAACTSPGRRRRSSVAAKSLLYDSKVGRRYCAFAHSPERNPILRGNPLAEQSKRAPPSQLSRACSSGGGGHPPVLPPHCL